MPNPPIHAPWRMEYIRSIDPATKPKPTPGKPEPCFICEASKCIDDPVESAKRLVLWATPLSIVIMNRFPYTNGHLLVAPREHHADLDALTDEQAIDLTRQTFKAVALLRRASSPQGFNVGMNLGRCAGAGLPGHLHQHVVPRWSGDVNFMSVIGEIRIVPQALQQLYEEFMRAMGTSRD